MRKSLFVILSLLLSCTLVAQDSTKTAPKKKQVIDLSGRPNDHLMFQFGMAGWGGKPDSINTKGFNKSVNFYLMLDFPVKTNPKLSIGFGAGFGTDHIYFDKMYLGIKDGTSTLTIEDRSDSVYFKRYKLAVAWLEAPIELRYTKNPLNSNKSFKVAIGVKVGTLFNAHTRGNDFIDITNNTNPYTQKEASKRFFNKNRLAVTGRVGLGVFSLFGSYQVTQLFKENLAPKINPWSVGLQISGL
jgi:Outer membrane protein beta-barrel domain